MKMQMLLDSHLDFLRVRNYSSGTIKTHRNIIPIFFRHLHGVGIHDLREVNRQTIEDYQRELVKHHAVGTARAHMGALRSFFARLENIGEILLNPTAGVPLAKEERRLPKSILKPSEVRRLLAAPDESPKGLRDRAMLELFYSSGIRREEMARLTLPAVDIKNGFVRVHGKGSKERIVPIGQRACEALARYLKDARAAWLKAERNPGWTDALWLSPIQPHPPIHREAVGAIVTRYAKKNLGRNVSPHLWRHSYATHLVANGANIVYVQRLLGHKSLKTTDIYTRVTMSDLKKTLQRAHPCTRQTAAPPALTREDAAKMSGGHRYETKN